MEYPRDLLEIQVLDDSTDDTHPFHRTAGGRIQGRRAIPSSTFIAPTAHGYKAGALQNGLKTATGEIVAIFDADFVPPVDFLERTVHQFADPKVGMVQTRWAYLNRHYNFLTEVQAMLLDGHFVLEHVARSGRRTVFQFQRHGRHPAPVHDRRRRRLAARHADRRFRSELSRAAQGLEIRLPAVGRVPVGTAGRNLRFPGPAIALGEGTDAGRDEAAADHSSIEPAVAREGRSVFSSDAEYFLSADDRRFRADAAGDDRAVLHGLVPDGGDRSAADRGVVLVDFGVLRDRASRAVSEERGSGRFCFFPR